MSLAGRLLNVVAAPGEVFESIKAAPVRTANWLVPVLIACAVGIMYVLVVFSQESIQLQLREAQEKAFQQQVEAGKMTQQQADQAVAVTQRFSGPAMMKIFGSVGAVFGNFAYVFLVGLALFLVGARPSDAKRWARWIGAVLVGFFAALLTIKLFAGMGWQLRVLLFFVSWAVVVGVMTLLIVMIDRINPFGGSFTYMKAVEVCALAGMVNVLGGIVTMLLAVAMGSLYANPGPVLLIREFDVVNKVHLALAAVNLVVIWYTLVLGAGLAKLSGASFIKSFLWLFVPYATLRAGVILLGVGQ